MKPGGEGRDRESEDRWLEEEPPEVRERDDETPAGEEGEAEDVPAEGDADRPAAAGGPGTGGAPAGWDRGGP
jgi:hypothetical protein